MMAVNPAAEDDGGLLKQMDVSPASDVRERKRPPARNENVDDGTTGEKVDEDSFDSPESAQVKATTLVQEEAKLMQESAAIVEEEVEEEEEEAPQEPAPNQLNAISRIASHPRMRAFLHRLEHLQNHYDPTHVTMLKGALVCLFGGKYFYSAVVVETLLKWYQPHPDASACVQSLSSALKTTTTAADDFSDQYNDARRNWLTRKLSALLMIASPRQFKMLAADAFKALLVISAVLRSRALRILVLGSIIGVETPQFLSAKAKSKLESAFPSSYRKWFPLAYATCTKLAGCAVALSFYKFLGPLLTALRGAKLFASGFRDWCKKHDQGHVLEGGTHEVFVWGVMVFGLYVQLFVWPTLPLPLKMLFLPAVCGEWLLSMFSA